MASIRATGIGPNSSGIRGYIPVIYHIIFRVLSTTREIEEFFREIISYMTRNILMFGGVFFFLVND